MGNNKKIDIGKKLAKMFRLLQNKHKLKKAINQVNKLPDSLFGKETASKEDLPKVSKRKAITISRNYNEIEEWAKNKDKDEI